MKFLDLLVLALATWRISNILVKEDGPFRVFERARARLRGRPNCIYCVSVWVAAGLFAIHLLLTPYVAWVFAISGAALMLRAYTGVTYDPLVATPFPIHDEVETGNAFPISDLLS